MRVVLFNAGEGVGEAAFTLQAEIVRQLSTKGKGKLYVRGGRVHRASRPGDPPAPDFGDLRNSAIVERKSSFHYEVAVTAPYAIPLELGTETIEPRPFMRPALQKSAAAMRKKMVARLKRKR